MKIIECEQKTPEWFAARCGIPTASSFDKLITTTGKQSAQRTKYMYQLAGERVSGKSEDGFQSAAMLRGIETESEARRFYEFTSSQTITQVGFCLSDCGRYGASPDGLVGEDGLLEIKCPTLAVHVGYLLENKPPTDYFQQTQGQLFVTGRKWSDFISYYPGLQPLVIRVTPDQAFHQLLSTELTGFCGELEQIILRISNVRTL